MLYFFFGRMGVASKSCFVQVHAHFFASSEVVFDRQVVGVN